MLSCGHTGGRTEDNEVTPRFGFWFLVGYAATQLATQLQERCIQVVRSNKEAWKRLTESNGTPAMDLGLMNVVLKEYYFYFLFYDCCFEVDICIRRYTNKRWIEQNTHEQWQIYFELEQIWCLILSFQYLRWLLLQCILIFSNVST